jgi:hypothetical protein
VRSLFDSAQAQAVSSRGSVTRRLITLIVRRETRVKRRGPSVTVAKDEGRPLGVGRQRQASNQAVRLEFKRLWS